MRRIEEVAADLGLSPAQLFPWGPHVAKLAPEVAFAGDDVAPPGRLVLVSAINPTPAGEGKTTTSIGLTQGARKNGVRAVAALREPSLGPVFGQKGGGTGGGRSQLLPSERINLHFTGDLHAITSAHNLLCALVDNELHHGQRVQLDGRQVLLRRTMDMNDRALRKIVVGLGGKTMGIPREDGFDITAASEVMAVLCLARDWTDLKRRLGDILVGFGKDGAPVRARDLGADGPMAALLRDALLPNLVQTTEGAPALVHGGPFANIAHGCNSVVATRTALRHGEVVFTEGGFGFDLGGEKFLDIKCRLGGLFPHAVVLVATLRALKYHGGVPAKESAAENREALLGGLENLRKHVESVRGFGLEPVVALNVRPGDTVGELDLVAARLREEGVECAAADVFGQGGDGARALAEIVVAKARSASPVPRFTYELTDSPADKIRKVAASIYGARDVVFTPQAHKALAGAARVGLAEAPVCMAKTHLSLSDDEKRVGRPRDFAVTVREVRYSAGAGFLVALTGELMTMPGLPKVPEALQIDLGADGVITGVH
jgi:formate--tetrahydrofolate ligase